MKIACPGKNNDLKTAVAATDAQTNNKLDQEHSAVHYSAAVLISLKGF